MPGKKKKGKVKETAADPSVVEFVRHLREDPSYVAAFLVTLELNKLESRYQKQREPMVFRKQVDKWGIVQWFEMNPLYKGLIPPPKTRFTPEEAAAIGKLFNDVDRVEQLKVMLMVGEIEHIVLSQATREQLENAPPPIWKEFDAYGFPEAYQINFPFQIGT